MTESNRIRVLIVDDHAMVREGLTGFLLGFDDLELLGEASDGEEAIRLCIETRPDVVLMDLVMPNMDGSTTTRLIRRNCPETQVIALTNFGDDDLVHAALEAGAVSYLLKNISAEELAGAIRAANAGRATMSPEATEALIRTSTRPPAPGHNLTPREREVLALMVEGLSNSEIGDRLTTSVSTVKFHVSNILSKLGVKSRVKAATIALQNNLVD